MRAILFDGGRMLRDLLHEFVYTGKVNVPPWNIKHRAVSYGWKIEQRDWNG